MFRCKGYHEWLLYLDSVDRGILPVRSLHQFRTSWNIQKTRRRPTRIPRLRLSVVPLCPRCGSRCAFLRSWPLVRRRNTRIRPSALTGERSLAAFMGCTSACMCVAVIKLVTRMPQLRVITHKISESESRTCLGSNY